MKLKRKLATIALTGGLALTGMAATAPSASAAEKCDSNQVCLYRATGFVRMGLETTDKNGCFDLYSLGFSQGVKSYINNLPVKVDIYHWNGNTHVYDGTIRPGGSSSNTGIRVFGTNGMACTGSAG
ncbi:peptidase inhibitor family I36 protein [Streptomyces sp. NBC_00250]|uniref:peptidase inhibitor family I36 protein n=1 Tax=Streptomyces sp. NBC_00250 TaxID=2903641 RepID=UPI002E2A7A59|nr:peptidase inhibitor family I36 protein [Streptomyces sp. NBC_00250]